MTDEQKQALIEEHRDINIYDDWWDCTYDDFKADMEAKGIHVSDIWFSGFWSQGDGASFTGYISDNKKFFEQHELMESYPWIANLMSLDGDFTLNIERTGHRYAHENTVSVEVSFTDMFYNVLIHETGGDLRRNVIEQWDAQLDAEYATISGPVTEIIRDYCRDLYRRLEEEYNYLTSDEAVWDAIVANDLDVIEEEEEETV